MSFKLCRLLFIFTSFITMSATAQSHAPIRHTNVRAFSPKDVTITTGDLRKAAMIDKTVIRSVEPDRLLYTFRKNAGLPNAKGILPYGGWEAPNVALRGHTTGHYLTALSYWYAQESTTEVKQRIDYIVNTLAECQQALGGGYLSAFPEHDIDTIERSGNGWAPHYTLHKVLQGLLDAHTLGENAQALTIAKNLGDWLALRAEKITDVQHWNTVLDKAEQGGIVEALLNLYELTGDPRHLTTANFYEQQSKIRPAAEGIDVLNQNITPNYQHANATIPQFIGVTRKYELTGIPYYHKAATFFWNQVVGHRCFSNGTTGYNEYWFHGPDSLKAELGIKAGETCATYNLIKLSNDLFRISPDRKYADYVERAIYNDILSALHPTTGGMMYFHTQEPGGFKTYGKNLEVFWCCTGTGMESHLRYVESIYFHSDDALFINLYVPSVVQWREKGVQIEQHTDFPDKANTSFVIEGGSSTYTLKFRVPYWATQGIIVRINRKQYRSVPDTTGYVSVTRLWKAGDKVDLELPMGLHLEKLPDDPQYASVLYGPLVLAGALGREQMADSLVMTTDYFFGDVPAPYAAKIPVPDLTGRMDDLRWIQHTGKPLSFQTKNTSTKQPLSLKPVYRIADERFAAYWRFTTP